jgi:hypothetical protein
MTHAVCFQCVQVCGICVVVLRPCQHACLYMQYVAIASLMVCVHLRKGWTRVCFICIGRTPQTSFVDSTALSVKCTAMYDDAALIRLWADTVTVSGVVGGCNLNRGLPQRVGVGACWAAAAVQQSACGLGADFLAPSIVCTVAGAWAELVWARQQCVTCGM